MCAYGSELYDPSWHAWVVIRWPGWASLRWEDLRYRSGRGSRRRTAAAGGPRAAGGWFRSHQEFTSITRYKIPNRTSWLRA